MDLPDYVSIPLVLIIFILFIILFAALLYCCRWLCESHDLPIKDIGDEMDSKPCTSTYLLKKKVEEKLFEKWDVNFVVYHKQAWIRCFNKRQVVHVPI